ELAFIGNQDLAARSRAARWFLDSLHGLEALAAAYTVYCFFRPIHYRLATHPDRLARASTILEKHGSDALDYYKLLSDKSYFFHGYSFVAYTTSLNVAICLGDPVGPEAELEELIRKISKFCHENDWKLAFLQVGSKNLALFEKLKFDVLKVGEDAVVDLNEFSEKTIKGKSFKSTIKKFEKQGFTLKRFSPPHEKQTIDTVESISSQWLSLPGRRERGFSLGWFARDELDKNDLFVLYDPESRAIAFVNQVKSYAPGEASIDMMRHGTDIPNGSMDFLFARLFEQLKEEGYERFNLGLAALSGVGDKPDVSLEEKECHQIYEHMNRFFSYKGLRQYKSKFKPDWQERFLIYEGGTPGLIKTALAITRAVFIRPG
ncbi:MAG: phosphatidylglycerol lysyltransferase domain-containing protein, partial [Candidatus Obscuribacterales bacterium]|nr:phosphatidylglycerol lysyltransferase domain-containing protein [Candidatus Obscuribacterales bacterium]